MRGEPYSAYCVLCSGWPRGAEYSRRSGERKGPDGEPWGASEALIIGQQVGAEVLGEGDVEPVGDGDGVPETPSIREQAANLHRHQRPSQKFGDRGRYLIDGKDVVELPPAKYSPAFGEEMVRYPRDSVGGKKPAKSAAAHGVGC